MQSRKSLSTCSRLPTYKTYTGALRTTDRSNLDTSQREPFARLALRLNQYLSSAEPLKEGEKEEELIPVDMSNYGFRDVPEVLDLCTAVSPSSFTWVSVFLVRLIIDPSNSSAPIRSPWHPLL
jgi:hypothetical protein